MLFEQSQLVTSWNWQICSDNEAWNMLRLSSIPMQHVQNMWLGNEDKFDICCRTRYYRSCNCSWVATNVFMYIKQKAWCNVDHHNRATMYLQATCSTLKHALRACKMLHKECYDLVALLVCLRPGRSTPCAGDCYSTAPTWQPVLWTSSHSTRKGEAQVLPSWSRVLNSLIILASCSHL